MRNLMMMFCLALTLAACGGDTAARSVACRAWAGYYCARQANCLGQDDDAACFGDFVAACEILTDAEVDLGDAQAESERLHTLDCATFASVGVTREELCETAISAICPRWAECHPGADVRTICEPWVRAILCPEGTGSDVVLGYDEHDLLRCQVAGATRACASFDVVFLPPPDECGTSIFWPLPDQS